MTPTIGWLPWFVNVLIAILAGMFWQWHPAAGAAFITFVLLNNLDRLEAQKGK